mgnify:CR=1 FL=1|tara:strand:+ start:331 stop:522 length:192 start_codon:yes stop_codon:yes gene_type:complete
MITNKSSDLTEVNTIISKLKYLKFENQNNEFIVTLTDNNNYEILKGYGKTKIDAVNDLHSNLI